MQDEVHWQVIFPSDGYDFGILLDWDFAEMMVSSRISDKKRERMNELAQEMLKEKHPTPYIFHDGTAFVRQFNTSGSGVWLAVDRAYGRSPIEVYEKGKPVQYSSHNVDSSSDVVSLQRVVDLWDRYSDELIG